MEVLLLLLLLLTPARAITLFILPLVLFLIYRRFPYKLKYRYGSFALIGLFMISSLLGLTFDTTSVEGVVLSCIIFLPMILFLFCEPTCFIEKKEICRRIAKPFMYIILVINVLGLFFWLRGGVDDYGVAYGRHYEFVHGLAMINIYVFLWFTMKFFYDQLSKKEWIIWGFISFSIYGCSFGLGYICLFLSFVIFLLGRLKIKSLLLLLLLLIGVYGISQSSYFWYERQNITKISENVDVRKVTMFNDFYMLINKDARIFYFGTGPGGYNSRSTLLLSGDNGNFINKELGNIEPIYYKKNIYPLWNRNLVSQDAYTDGTRNKPFSNFISIWAEQGVFFLFIFSLLYCSLIRHLRNYKNHRFEYYYLLSLDIFMIVSMISHLWLETTEFLMYCLIRFFIQMYLKSDQRILVCKK